MRQLTHIQVPRGAAEEIGRRPRPTPPILPPSQSEDGSFWPCAPAALVRIYEIEKEWTIPAWLCPAAVAQRQAEGWRIRLNRAPPFADLACDVHRGSCPGRPA